MKTSFVGANLALALTLLAAPAFAEDFHCPKPGTVLTFSDGGSITVTGQMGFMCQVQGKKGSFDRLLGIASTESGLFKNHGERLFPWRIGTEIEYDYSADTTAHVSGSTVSTGSLVYYHDTVKVVRQEKLVTAAGTFDTFVIEWHEDIKNRGIQGAWLYTVWFAPDVGYAVKQTTETKFGYGSNTAWEITSITPGSSPAAGGPEPCLPGMKFGVYDDCKTPPAPPAAATPPATPALAPVAKTVTPKPTSAPVATAAPTPTPAPTASPPASVEGRLNALKDLLDRKVITPEEYTEKRKEILKSL